MNMTDLLVKGLEKFRIQVTQQQIEQFIAFNRLLLEWNERFNLTTITSEEDVAIKHFLDSLSGSLALDLCNKAIADLGTGAGFPGIPLKIVFRDIEITFVDSSSKKISFIDMVCKELGFSKYRAIHENIERFGREDKNRGGFDIVTTRALSELSCLIEYSMPLLKVNGRLLAYKGPNCEKEVENSTNAMKVLKAKIEKTVDIELPFSNIQRKILVVEKLGITDDKYPRNVGIPKKRPL